MIFVHDMAGDISDTSDMHFDTIGTEIKKNIVEIITRNSKQKIPKIT
jgi:hypothetical protein